MNKNTIAVQLYTLRDFTKTAEDVEKTLKKVKEIGYNAVQISGMGPVDPVFVKGAVNNLQLKVCATHVSFERLQTDIKSVINDHKLWDCQYVGVGSMPNDYRTGKEGYIKFAREASAIGKELAANGLKLIYHNHAFEFQKFDGVTGMDILLNETTSDVGFEIDTFWVQTGGGNPVQWLKKVAGRIDVVHFKDMEIIDNQQTMAAIGEGNLDWPSIIDICREIGVKWYAVEQDVCPRDPFDCLASSLNYLKKFV